MLRIGELTLVDREGRPFDFIFFVDSIEFPLLSATKSSFDLDKMKSFSFILIMEKLDLEYQIEPMKEKIYLVLLNRFFIPYCCAMLSLMVVVTYMLHKIARYITDPVIELYFRIKNLIQATKNKFDKGSSDDFDIMLNYTETNLDINQLYLSVSKVAKTTKFAK